MFQASFATGVEPGSRLVELTVVGSNHDPHSGRKGALASLLFEQ